MEKCLQEANNLLPPREIICALAEKFSSSADRAGKIVVQPKQVWNWFQNRRYARRARSSKGPEKLIVSTMPRDDSLTFKNAAPSLSAPSVKNSSDSFQVEFEAKSARDGAWYDVSAFISHRTIEAGDPEVRVRFAGFGAEEDEWVDVVKCVRLRSLPCEASECAVVIPGDLILCFQEGKEQALYFDAHVLDAQRRRHDSRGCRCRFLVRYDHDQSEEIVPLRKVCRRPETDYRLKMLQASRAAALESSIVSSDPTLPGSSKEVILAAEKPPKQWKSMDVTTAEVATVVVPELEEHVVSETPPTNIVADNDLGGPKIPQEDDAFTAVNPDKVVQDGSPANPTNVCPPL
ncbi:protein SAWADEE HOMEODOMAIN HOMOLOG 2-like isoform X3 [Dioscorea cayenensis subsp. rotundata]|nr:protein SAWADEE HOMEODOMAIN HOMOLOG 2-like isoform X3 [Dioscorea cayenensis subsp. rotundata]